MILGTPFKRKYSISLFALQKARWGRIDTLRDLWFPLVKIQQHLELKSNHQGTPHMTIWQLFLYMSIDSAGLQGHRTRWPTFWFKPVSNLQVTNSGDYSRSGIHP